MLVFLDVDDLENIDNLEEHVRESCTVLILLGSDKYFSSMNCMREVAAAEAAGLPLILVYDSNQEKGNAPLAALMEACPAERRPYIFGPSTAPRPVVEWHRAKMFQLVSLAQIAEQMLLALPSFSSANGVKLFIPRALPWAPPSSLRSSTSSLRSSSSSSVVVPLYLSPLNPQAEPMAAEVREFCSALGDLLPPSAEPPKGDVSDVRWLLVVSTDTFKGEDGARFADQLHAGLQSTRIAPIVVYEPELGPFQQVMQETPTKLKLAGLYTPLAVEWRGGAHRAVSVRMLVRSLFGPPARLRGRWEQYRQQFGGAAQFRHAVIKSSRKKVNPVHDGVENGRSGKERLIRSTGGYIVERFAHVDGGPGAANGTLGVQLEMVGTR